MIDFGRTAGEFRENHLERQVFLQKAALREDPFRWSELDELLHQIEPRSPVFQLFERGPVPEAQFTEPSVEFGAPRLRLNKLRFYSYLRNGATLVINRLDNYSLRAKRLCGEIGRFAGCQPIGNAYLSVGGRGTFGKHWDTHEVFAIQLLGRKRWRVYPPTFPLPLNGHTSERSGQHCPTEPALDCILGSGDLLYVPRGWWHETIPLNEPSLHLSVGTYGPTVYDYLMWVCSQYLASIESVRRSLARGLDRAELEAILSRLSAVAGNTGRQSDFANDVAGRQRLRSELNTKLFLEAGAAGLTNDAALSLNRLDGSRPKPAVREASGTDSREARLAASIVAALEAGAPTLEALYDRLPEERCDEIRRAVLDLSQHEVLNIEQPSEPD